MIEVAILSIYVFCLISILLYCLAELTLAITYVNKRQHRKQERPALANNLAPEKYPFVTIQLPIFNEMYVVERLVDAITAFDYPKSRFEIQVLDDSTDETLHISQKKVTEYQRKGFNISLHHRVDRTGFKAGALQAALPEAKGEFVAIFDADFIPNPDFLLRTLPYFDEPKVGVVQTRWEHINKNYSLLTQIQAFYLDVHFTVEQAGRNMGGFFMNFNGTAGLWRKSTIADAGGWQADTLTEDLDLSYRSQLKGWEFVYLENISSPSELPADMRAFKSQQFRWIKGGAEVARKMLPSIKRSDLPFAIKFNAFAHLLSSSVYIAVFLLAFLSVPLMLVKNQFIDFNYLRYSGLFFLSNFAVIYVFFIATKYRHTSGELPYFIRFLYLLPSFLAITLGLSLHNGLAALRGLLREETPFIRTPKFNITTQNDAWENKKYTSRQIEFITVLEGLLMAYFLGAIVYGIATDQWAFLPFHLFACLGFAATFWYSVRHAKVVRH